MSKSKKISFVVPDYIYDGLASLPILCGDLTVSFNLDNLREVSKND